VQILSENRPGQKLHHQVGPPGLSVLARFQPAFPIREAKQSICCRRPWIDIIKAFPLGEGIKLELRLEAMNIFNHPNFYVIPSASVVGSPGPAGEMPSRFLNKDYTYVQPRTMNVQLKIVF